LIVLLYCCTAVLLYCCTAVPTERYCRSSILVQNMFIICLVMWSGILVK
jgi:hypothetical protein